MVATKRIAFVTIYYFFVSLITVIIWGFGLVGIIAMSDIVAVEDSNGGGYHK